MTKCASAVSCSKLPAEFIGCTIAMQNLPPGASTQEHYHVRAEEIYYITHGTGRMRIGSEMREVKAGDAVAIPPGSKHKLWNIGNETLRLLCCCAPAYEHSDTIITESGLDSESCAS